MPGKKQTTRIGKWYKADDEPTHFIRKRTAPKPSHLRKSIQPGQVLILLAGRFRGKRVVFLKQLKSGLLLVTGPHKVNGVPLKRVNQAYVIPTSTKVDIAGVKADVDDTYFAKTKIPKRKNEQGFWAKSGELTEEQKKAESARLLQKRTTQKGVDSALLATIKKTQFLKSYLGARFTIGKTIKPHDLVF